MEEIYELMHKTYGIILFCIGVGMIYMLFRTYHISLDELCRAIYDNHVISMR